MNELTLYLPRALNVETQDMRLAYYACKHLTMIITSLYMYICVYEY